MSAPASPPSPERLVRTLRFRSLEQRWRSEEALDRGDLPDFWDRRHTSGLERAVADELEARSEKR